MKVTILCSSAIHPVNSWLERWIKSRSRNHDIELVRDAKDASGGDVLFLISCNQIVKTCTRDKYAATLVIHASDLPRGRGWSPHVWQIIGGADEIVLSLLEAGDQVDTGRIWKKLVLPIEKTWLYDEINEALFKAELELMDFVITNWDTVSPIEQASEVDATYYRKRRPEDSRIDPEESISEQFDTLRVSDPDRFPAFFEYRGRRYRLVIERY